MIWRAVLCREPMSALNLSPTILSFQTRAWASERLSLRHLPFMESIFLFVCLVTKPCPTLCDPMDCSPPGSSVHGIAQARILEWVAISLSRGSSWPRDRTHVSCIGRWILYQGASREALTSSIQQHLFHWTRVGSESQQMVSVQVVQMKKLQWKDSLQRCEWVKGAPEAWWGLWNQTTGQPEVVELLSVAWEPGITGERLSGESHDVEGRTCQIPVVKGKESPAFWSLSVPTLATAQPGAGHQENLEGTMPRDQSPEARARQRRDQRWGRGSWRPASIVGARSTKSLPSSSFHSAGRQTLDTPNPATKPKKG